MVNKIFISCCFLAVLFSCQVSKNVPKGFYLLQNNEVKLQKSGGTLTAADLKKVIRQQPNQKLIGMPFRLTLYNMVDSAKVASKRHRRNEAMLEENQRNLDKMNRINQKRILRARKKGRDYYTEKIIPMKDIEHPRRFFREWLKFKYGEKPVIFDTNLYVKSIDQLGILLRKKGYYESLIQAEINKDYRNRTATVTFQVNAGKPYIIDSIFLKGASKITSHYNSYISRQVKATGEHPLLNHTLDEDMLANHSELVAREMRDMALFGFTNTNIRYLADTNSQKKTVTLGLEFLPRRIPHASISDSFVTVAFDYYYVNKVIFHLSDTNRLSLPFSTYLAQKNINSSKDALESSFLATTEVYEYRKLKCDKKAIKRFQLTKHDFNPFRKVDVYYNGDKPGVKPHLLELQNFLEPTNYFKDKYLERSYQFLSQLNLFTTIKPVFYEVPGKNQVNVHYFLVPKKKQSFSFEPRFTSSFGLLGVNASMNYVNNNVFRGGEKFTFTLGGGFESQPIVFDDGTTGGRAFNTLEFGPSLKIEIPGLFPSPVWLLSKRQKPITVIGAGLNFERRDIFTRRVFQMNYTWRWKVDKTQVFTFGLPFASTIKFVQFDNSDAFQNQINTLSDLFLRNSYSNQLIWEDFKFQFEFSNVNKDYVADEGHSSRKTSMDINLTSSISLAGNTLAFLTKNADTISGGQHTFYGNVFAEFIRNDNQLVLTKRFNASTQLAGKFMAGFGLPYGNSTTSMPYDYSFFAGGANDNRGWKARLLGPGVYKSYLDSTGTATQIGDIRIGGSVEFRFSLSKMLKSVVFTDFGNIWTSRTDGNRLGASFSPDFYKQLAFTLGTGLRIDLDFFIVRLDLGFPMRNPALPEKARWVFQDRSSYYLEGAQYYGISGSASEQIKAMKEIMPRPFLPSLHFGIGLPF
jgi:outer membrane protein insertion porin family